MSGVTIGGVRIVLRIEALCVLIGHRLSMTGKAVSCKPFVGEASLAAGWQRFIDTSVGLSPNKKDGPVSRAVFI